MKEELCHPVKGTTSQNMTVTHNCVIGKSEYLLKVPILNPSQFQPDSAPCPHILPPTA